MTQQKALSMIDEYLLQDNIDAEWADCLRFVKAEIERLDLCNKLLKSEREMHRLGVSEIVRKYQAKAVKVFADKLCEGRVSNDPVVIAVKAELKMTDRKEEKTNE